jgi:mRNA-degrading endonuclease toxin of MazEF toxin-antitoxin module
MGPGAIVVPATTKRRPWATRVRLQLDGVSGDAMCEQVRSIDTASLAENRFGRVSPATLAGTRETVARLIGAY